MSYQRLNYDSVLFKAMMVSLPTFQFGYHIGVLNPIADHFLTCSKSIGISCIPLTSTQFSLITSLLPLLGLIGTLSSQLLLTNYDLTFVYLLSSILFLLGDLGFSLSDNSFNLMISRGLVGLSSGLAMVIVPVGLNKIATMDERGKLGTFNQLSIVSGIISSQLLALFGNGWRYLFVLGSVIPITQFIYIYINRSNLFTCSNIEDNEHESNSPITPLSSSSIQQTIVTPYQLITTLPYKRSFSLILLVQLAQQLSGINPIVYYSTTILTTPTTLPLNAQLLTLSLNFAQLIATLLATNYIEKYGRKLLLLTSMSIMSLSLITISLAISFDWYSLTVIGLIICMLGFSLGLGPITFLILPELITPNALPTASSLALTLNLALNFLTAISFLPLANIFFNGNLTFMFLSYGIILGSLILPITKYLPETKGKTPYEIMDIINNNH